MIDNREGTLGFRLRMWRKHLKLKQIDFASMVHIHVGMIRKYEGDGSMPGSEILIEFAKTGLDINWLLMGIGEMSIKKETNQVESITQLLDGLDEAKRELLLSEFKSRIQDAIQLVELTAVVKSLSKPSDQQQSGESPSDKTA